jgi:hypothetical protein
MKQILACIKEAVDLIQADREAFNFREPANKHLDDPNSHLQHDSGNQVTADVDDVIEAEVVDG